MIIRLAAATAATAAVAVTAAGLASASSLRVSEAPVLESIQVVFPDCDGAAAVEPGAIVVPALGCAEDEAHGELPDSAHRTDESLVPGELPVASPAAPARSPGEGPSEPGTAPAAPASTPTPPGTADPTDADPVFPASAEQDLGPAAEENAGA